MSEIGSILRSAYDKTSFILDEKYLKKNEFISHYIEVIIGLLSNSNRERGVVLHQGTRVPLYFAIVLAGFKAYLSDDSDNTAFLDDLNIGDLVLYENKRGIYQGRDPNGNIIIVNKDRGGISTTNYVPITLANKVQPYYGDGKVLDGRGIKRQRNVSGIISELFGIKKQEIKSVINKGVVIVCDRFEADEIFGKMGILINGKQVKMCELFPAAYITTNEVYHYPGNVAKADPVIRFVNKISLARELVLEDKGICTLIVSDLRYFFNSTSELASIYERSSLKSIILLGEICKGVGSQVINELDNLKPFIWTRDVLANYENGYIQEEYIHDESKQLQRIINNHINLEQEVIQIEGPFSAEEFLQSKKNLLQLSKQPDESGLLVNIVKRAYWLINLLERSFFPISVMEQMISEGQINAPSPNSEFVGLELSQKQYLGTNIAPQLKIIIEEISRKMSEMNYKNPKFDYLLEKIINSKFDQKKISIICAKAYYQRIFIEAAPWHLRDIIQKIDFFTPNKYDSSKLYHNVYVVGVWDWSRLNPLLISNTRSVSFILYANELNRYHQADKHTKNRLAELNSKNSVLRDNSGSSVYNYEILANSDSEFEEKYIEDQLQTLTEAFSLSIFSEEYATSSSTVGQSSEIVKIAFLETGEKILFTRFYTAYIYNIDRQLVQETDVNSLNEGDLLVFTSYDSGTRDIVEKIMDIILESDSCSEKFREAYRKSKQWKILLREYINKRHVSYKQLSDIMEKLGATKHEVTLRAWLDEESHIIGPRDIDSYRIIAKILQDPEMLSSPETFFQSSREVRSMRVRVLKYLGKNIIKTHNKKEDVYDEILSLLPIDLTKMSRIVQIEKIIDTENLLVPSHLANRPVQI
ncbi:DrmE family protein [Paenibacillus sp. alder61]|uniref:DrmE family protein n=1 Tax=Paenibacillus sp. alder61 TaxID=2862948 RepID=UPI001CD2DCF4|nr:DrmE family protein [Paenibacillus sp. alder61]MCA1292222.1 DrmE family protein [Paenibacillus sp. alder61]